MALRRAKLPPVLLILGDDDWIVSEAVQRATAVFRETFRDGEVSHYAGASALREAVDDAATVALFATNRLVVLDGTDLFRTGKVTAEDLDTLLQEAESAGLSHGEGADRPALVRLARRALGLAAVAGLGGGTAAEVARRLAGRVRRGGRAADLTALLELLPQDAAAGEADLERLLAFASGAAGDNALLLTALHPDREHHVLAALKGAPKAELLAPDEPARRERLRALGLERALERKAPVDREVFDTLTERGRLSARPFLSELDKLIDAAAGKRVTADAAAKLVLDERKEYGSDFVEAVSGRQFVQAVGLLERLLSGGEFTAFRPFVKEEGQRKGPKGDAAFFPMLGLLAAELRRMLALRAAMSEGGAPGAYRRVDYRTFTERVLPALRDAGSGGPRPALEGHPFLLHRSYLAALQWRLPELISGLRALDAIDRDVKSGAGSGPELLASFLLTLAAP